MRGVVAMRGRGSRRGHGRGRAAALVTIAVLSLPVAGTRVAAAPADPGREPPQVQGLLLPEARAAIGKQWFGGQFVVVFEVVPEVPAQVGADAAVVVGQEVLDYGGSVDDVGPPPSPVIRLTVGSRAPDLLRTRPEAEALVGALGLELPARGPDEPDGSVVAEQPTVPGTLLAFGAVVDAGFRAPPATTIPVPDVGRRTEPDARKVLASAGLEMSVISTTGEGERLVTVQRPRAGTQVERGRTVRVVLEGTGGQQGPSVTVPDITGLDLEAVRAALAAGPLGLRVGSGSDSAAGLAFRQDPPPGAEAAPGTTVAVWFQVAPLSDRGGRSWWPWPAAGIVLLVALAGGGLLRRARRPPAGAPRAEPHPDPRPVVLVTPTGSGADLAVRVEPHPGPGHRTPAEVPR